MSLRQTLLFSRLAVRGLPVTLLQHDRDTKFTKSFDATLKRRRVKIIRGAYRAPNTNAFVERLIQSIEHECLDRFVVFGEQHLDHLCSEYVAHYHEERPHQSLENIPVKSQLKRGRPKTLRGRAIEEVFPLTEVQCLQRLGGFLKSYRRRAG